MKRVYNSNMAAVDDSVGRMRVALTKSADVFENKTLGATAAGNDVGHFDSYCLLICEQVSQHVPCSVF